jgi:hypothetical protein
MTKVEWDPNDRRGWRYSIGGRPVELGQLFADRLCGRNDLNVSNVCTSRSRPTWERFFKTEWKADEWIQKALACSTLVRHPAPGMAFVYFLVAHPDQTEPFTIERETLASVEALTLLYDHEIHDWRVHAMGAMGPPSDVGLVAFPKE